MLDGFIKVAAAAPDVKVADCKYNVSNIINIVKEQAQAGVKLIVFPELSVTGYTCGDLFFQRTLINGALDGLKEIAEKTGDCDILIFVGAPVAVDGKLYNCAVAIKDGEILAFIPKSNIPNYAEFYEKRYFEPADECNRIITVQNKNYVFGTDVILKCNGLPQFTVSAEICEDLWAPYPVSTRHACAGANIIVNLSASNDFIGKNIYRENLVRTQSGRLICGYVYSNVGEGESTTDLVFGGQNFIYENGSLLAKSKNYTNSASVSEIDVFRLESERIKNTSYPACENDEYDIIGFDTKICKMNLTRKIQTKPFVPFSETEKAERCEEILTIQSLGLKKRVIHTNAKSVVIGVSGGLDSTLALLVCAKTMDMLGRSRKDIIAVTMPCFGTTVRTRTNAEILCEKLGVTFKVIDIANAVNVHFNDIGHNEENHNVVYENSQARERTQILMDTANQYGGLVIGTGDLSELALGWSTYNGDHMSMYAVNASVPKTLIRHIVSYYADVCDDEKLKKALLDVLDTPVSPELLPPEDGVISQVTEDLVGPYELHDFFLYNSIRLSFEPCKVYRLACLAFKDIYSKEVILKWLKVFYRRFFSQQFKRSCLPDGPKVGSVALSPRGDLRMPSDACSNLWLDNLDNIKEDDFE